MSTRLVRESINIDLSLVSTSEWTNDRSLKFVGQTNPNNPFISPFLTLLYIWALFVTLGFILLRLHLNGNVLKCTDGVKADSVANPASLGIFCILSTTLLTRYPPFEMPVLYFLIEFLFRSELLTLSAKLKNIRALPTQTFRWGRSTYRQIPWKLSLSFYFTSRVYMEGTAHLYYVRVC